MFKCLSSSNPFRWVKSDHFHNKIQLNIRELWELILRSFTFELGEGAFEVGKLVNSTPALISRRTMELEDFKDLIDFRITHKKRSFLDQLSEDTTNGPHVNTKRVFFFSEKDLRGSVPKSFYFMGQRFDWNSEGSC